jgi:hypothetical protein
VLTIPHQDVTVSVERLYEGADRSPGVNAEHFMVSASHPFSVRDSKMMNSQKVIEEMAKQKAPNSRRANPEERGVLCRTPQ